MSTAKHTYIIGEIGQNHNGSVDVAKLIIELMALPVKEDLFGLKLQGMDAVKLTKRDLNQELSKEQMASAYSGRNAFGPTYGEHRAALELSDEEHFEAYKCAKSYGLDFVETLCAPACTSMLKLFTPDRLKVASRDLTNLPLLEVLAETQIPINLITNSLEKVFHFKFFCSSGNNFCVFTSDDAKRDVQTAKEQNTSRVSSVEFFPFVSGLVVVHTAICPNAINI